MIDYQRYTLDNGLRLVVHTDKSTPLVVVNILYKVGSKNEHQDKTGFAHLFEHLMFGGSANAPSFDDPIQSAGGDCNAFTNSDITNFYSILPAVNIELALWLEADRMRNLNIDEKSLGTQQQVVIEEFKETCINQPYGDVWHILSKLAFEVHPYQWPTIGKVTEHIEKANLHDVETFYSNHYGPNNAILVISGNIEAEEAHSLVEKWMGDIPAREKQPVLIPQEPVQLKQRRIEVEKEVPTDQLYMTFHMCERAHPLYTSFDLLSDVLAEGRSSIFYQKLVKEQHLCTAIDAYISGTEDPGLFVIEARPTEGVALSTVEEAIWKEISNLQNNPVSDRVLEKLKNRVENGINFSAVHIMHKAMNLAYFEYLDHIDWVNREMDFYRKVSVEQLQQTALNHLTDSNCSVMNYRSLDQKRLAV